MQGKGKIKYWFTRNGVHVPVYEKYTMRKGVEPEVKKATFNIKQSLSVKQIPKSTEVSRAPWGGGSNRKEVESTINANIEKAKAEGYEIIPRPYQTRGRSGQRYDWTEVGISMPEKTGGGRNKGTFKPSKSSKLGQHLENTYAEYEDVIVLPYKPVLPLITKGRQGWKTKYGAEYVVMARKKRKK